MTSNLSYSEIYNEARTAGLKAGGEHTPRPMVVGQAKDIASSEIDYSKKTYYVPDGVCGFAWIIVKGNSGFGRWAKKAGYAKPTHPSGLRFWVSDFNQSMERKEAYAKAFVEVLTKHDIPAYYSSRMD